MIALFIVFLVLIILLGIFLILYYPIKRYLDKKKYKELVGKKLYKLALNKDYYLLNNLVIKIDDEITNVGLKMMRLVLSTSPDKENLLAKCREDINSLKEEKQNAV